MKMLVSILGLLLGLASPAYADPSNGLPCEKEQFQETVLAQFTSIDEASLAYISMINKARCEKPWSTTVSETGELCDTTCRRGSVALLERTLALQFAELLHSQSPYSKEQLSALALEWSLLSLDTLLFFQKHDTHPVGRMTAVYQTCAVYWMQALHGLPSPGFCKFDDHHIELVELAR